VTAKSSKIVTMTKSHKTYTHFGLARTALKLGLSYYGVARGEGVLIPNFLCNVIYDELNYLGINVYTYNLYNDLSPNWDDIEEVYEKKHIIAILMVHYFGQHQDIFRFRKFCNENHLLLIEDNAHGHGSTYEGKQLGTYGDIGISSPRKFLNIDFGGCLYLKNNFNHTIPLEVHNPVKSTLKQKLKKNIHKFPYFYSLLKKIRYVWVDYSDPYYFQESQKCDFSLGEDDTVLIDETNWENVANKRRLLWREWDAFARLNSLTPVFSEVHSESSPWAYPVYTDNIEHRNKWINWGLKNNIILFPWPALPTVEIKKNSTALSRWKNMLCFPLDGVSPKALNEKYKTPNI